jgi:hypothetical protein
MATSTCRWFELLSYQVGVLEPTPVEVAIPEGCANTVATVAEHIALYLGLRDASDGGYGLGAPFTVTRSFATGYCGVSEKRRGWRWRCWSSSARSSAPATPSGWAAMKRSSGGWPSNCLTSCDSVVSHRELN